MQKLELLCSPHGSPSPPSLPPHPDSVLNLVWTIFLLLSFNCECIYMPAQLLRHVQLFGIPWTVARQVPLVQGILQARILEWVAIFSSRGSSQPRDWTCVSCIGRQILYHWGTWEAHLNAYTTRQPLMSTVNLDVNSNHCLELPGLECSTLAHFLLWCAHFLEFCPCHHGSFLLTAVWSILLYKHSPPFPWFSSSDGH